MLGPKSAKVEYNSLEARSKWIDLSRILNRIPGARKSLKDWRKVRKLYQNQWRVY